MVVYRCVSERELAAMLGLTINMSSSDGDNTFKYEKEISYKHFFYYYDSAVSFMDIQNINRYNNKYAIILACDIDDDILKDCFGLGKYNLEGVEFDAKDDLRLFKTIYYPEFAIPEELLKKEMIVGVGSRRITPVSYSNYEQLEENIKKSEQDFSNYKKWLLGKGNNISIDEVLENRDQFFPIGEADKVKKI